MSVPVAMMRLPDAAAAAAEQQKQQQERELPPPAAASCATWDIEKALERREGKFKRNYRRNWAELLEAAAAADETTTGSVPPPLRRRRPRRQLRGAELGVWKGDLAEAMLSSVPSLAEYILVDPWRHLDDWDKPFNKDDETFQKIYQVAMRRTRQNAEYGHKVKVLRNTTGEAATAVEDGSLDFVYIDGDHTLRGALQDLVLWAPKVRCGGVILGDDYYDQNPGKLKGGVQPTMVKTAVQAYVAALGYGRIYSMGADQFGFVKKH